MEPVPRRHWFLTLLQCILTGAAVDSVSLSSATHLVSVTYKVGNQAILPCNWKSRLGEQTLSTCHIQWTSPVDTVFEQQGMYKWQAVELNGRAAVPEEKLESGDCSLVISDVQIGDTGRYESFMVVDGVRSEKTRVFIQGVKLSVFDHKSSPTRVPGEDFVLELYTPQAMRVVFQGRNSSEWVDLWTSGEGNTQRVEKHQLKDQLTIKKLQSSDEGLYKVLDGQGLAVSTVDLSVREISTALKVHQATKTERLADDAVRSSWSALLILSVLVSGFQIPCL